MKCLTLKFGAALCTGVMLAAGSALASEYPDHAITMVVPFSPGGPADIAARSLAESMRPSLGKTIIIENKAGAGGTIGTAQVAHARPDGYTILMMHLGFTTAPSLYKKPGYNAQADFQPIGLAIDVPMTIIARSDFPPNTIQEFMDYLKANKDKVSMANAGVGSASHLCGIMLTNALGIKLLTVPYKGTAPAMNDLLGKQVDFICDQTTSTSSYIKDKAVKAYAVTSKQRVPSLPSLPTLQESGLKGFEIGVWFGLWTAKGAPKPAVDKLVSALQAGLADENFKNRMVAMGAAVLPGEANPEALAQKVNQQVPLWKGLFENSGIKPQ